MTFFTRIVQDTGTGLALQEVLYGFIMAMLFIVAASIGLIEVQTNTDVIILIVGMNFTWGMIDMIIFYFVDVADQMDQVRTLKGQVPGDRREKIRESLSETIVDLIDEDRKQRIIDILTESDVEPTADIKVERKSMFISAFGCFLLTMLAAVPAIICLLIIPELHTALTVAGLVSSICMFFIGYYMGPYLGTKGWKSGLSILVMAMGITVIATFTGG